MLQIMAKATGKAIASSPSRYRWIENLADFLSNPVNIPWYASMLPLTNACFY